MSPEIQQPSEQVNSAFALSMRVCIYIYSTLRNSDLLVKNNVQSKLVNHAKDAKQL